LWVEEVVVVELGQKLPVTTIIIITTDLVQVPLAHPHRNHLPQKFLQKFLDHHLTTFTIISIIIIFSTTIIVPTIIIIIIIDLLHMEVWMVPCLLPQITTTTILYPHPVERIL
jgi:hypothetical protein